jgi:uncharacterized membrane protein (DUF4010 family)
MMVNTELFLRFGSAILIGILIGLQREYAYSSRAQGGLFAGARTFALMALFGASAAFLADVLSTPWVFIMGVILVGGLVSVAYFITASERDEIGLTSEVAALLTILIGGICYLHSIELAAALGVMATVLLAVKLELQKFIKVITREDVFATLQFAVITAIVLPILPNRTYGPPPIDVLNPYKIWEIVVFISAINFLGYILIKIVGPKRGLGISGILGGLASSTATTLSFSQRSKTQGGLEKPFAVAIITSWVIMFVRIVIEVAVINSQLLPLIWPAMAAMGGTSLLYALYLYYSQSAVDEEEMQVTNPFELGPAVKFGLIFALVLLVTRAADLFIGEKGIFLTSFLAGLADVDAITLSISDLTRSGGSISLITGRIGIILAAISNTFSKGMLVFLLSTKKLSLRVLPAILMVLLIGLGFIFIS